MHIEQTRAGAEGLVYAIAYDLLDGRDPAAESTEGESMVILGLSEPVGDTARWLLSGGRRIYLANWENVQRLIDAGFPTILLAPGVLQQIPEVR